MQTFEPSTLLATEPSSVQPGVSVSGVEVAKDKDIVGGAIPNFSIARHLGQKNMGDRKS